MLPASELATLPYPEFCEYVAARTDYADIVALFEREPLLRERIANCVRSISNNRLPQLLAINWQVLFNFINLEESQVPFPVTLQELLNLAYHPKLRTLAVIIAQQPLTEVFTSITRFAQEYQSGSYDLRGVPARNDRSISRLRLRVFLPNPQLQNGVRVRNTDVLDWDQITLTLSLEDPRFLLQLPSFWNMFAASFLWFSRGPALSLADLRLRVQAYGYHVNLDPLIIAERDQRNLEAYEVPITAVATSFLRESARARAFSIRFSTKQAETLGIEVARRFLYRLADRLTVPLAEPLQWRVTNLIFTYPLLQRFAPLLPNVQGFRVLYDRSIAGVYPLPALLRITNQRRITLVAFPGVEAPAELPPNFIYVPFALDTPIPDL